MELHPDQVQEVVEAVAIAAANMQSLRREYMKKGDFVAVRDYTEKFVKFSQLSKSLHEEYGELLDPELMGQLERSWASQKAKAS